MRYVVHMVTLSLAVTLGGAAPAGAASDAPSQAGHDSADGAVGAETFRWRAHGQADGLPARRAYDVVYDRANDRHVFFGGGNRSGPAVLGGTFVRTDGVWSELDTEGAPAPRRRYSMVYDPAHEEVVLFGGEVCEVCPTAETWVLTGNVWEQRTPPVSPPATRWGPGQMAYDPVREEVVFVQSGQTWIWDGSTWDKQSTSTHPRNVDFFAMAWDRSSERLILQGGFDFVSGESFYRGETWAWDGARWSRLADGPPVAFHAMSPFDGRVVLFGGRGEGGIDHDSTWRLEGDEWVELDVRRRPPGHGEGQLVQLGRNRLLLFGGYGVDYRDEWVLRRSDVAPR